ncbi:preprotein translocase subunit SecE [Kitasatospora sp. NPDC086791]|uniref:preprotein translocase subunit SecE n=1 Tax=Kitasatospora sp. NPDC086791 TaxID=3155178 RepID=UPI00341507A3
MPLWCRSSPRKRIQVRRVTQSTDPSAAVVAGDSRVVRDGAAVEDATLVGEVSVPGSGRRGRPGARRRSGRTSRRSRQSLPARSGRFYRQVVAELGKVVWPGRAELLGYTRGVTVFVAVTVTVVAALDWAWTRLLVLAFG